MSVVVVSCNQRSAPIDVLERVTIAPRELPKTLQDLSLRDDLSEVVVLSTCNRVEIYAVCDRFHSGVEQISGFLADHSGLTLEQLAGHAEVHVDDAAASHLFSVAAGLDSAVVGEHEILGQVRDAFEAAQANQAVGPRLASMFKHALTVGKRTRTETDIARGTASVSAAAVELAGHQLGSLVGRSVLVLGAGEIGVSLAVSLRHAGVGEIFVANRSRPRAQALADRISATTVPLHELPAALEQVDVLLTATSADSYVLERSDLELVMLSRGGRPLVIVDAALPRDIDPSAGDLEGLSLLDLVAIREFADVGRAARAGEMEAAESIVADELERFRIGGFARQVAPVVTAFRSGLESIRQAELDRHEHRLAALDPATRELIETLTHKMVAKIAHGPTARLKDNAGSAKGHRLADAMRDLFDL